MKQNLESSQIRDNRAIYKPFFDIMQLFCVILLVLCSFQTNFAYAEYVQLFGNFSVGTLFTMFGFMVLRDGEDLKPHVRRLGRCCLFLLLAYLPLTAVFSWLYTGSFFGFYSFSGLLNFLLLNTWWNQIPICSNFWIVQSAFYALLIFWALKKWKRFDWILCIVLFAFATAFGDLQAVLHLPFYFSGNFLTRTMPYMLLGRVLHRFYGGMPFLLHKRPLLLFWGGLFLALAEFAALGWFGYLNYYNHLIGFIPISAGLCLYCYRHNYMGEMDWLIPFASTSSKWIFCAYSPLGYFFYLLCLNLCTDNLSYSVFYSLIGTGTVLLLFLLSVGYRLVYLKLQEYDRKGTVKEEDDEE